MLRLICFALLILFSGLSGAQNYPAEFLVASCGRVVDGDTVDVDVLFLEGEASDVRRLRIRMYGIDAPEKRQDGGSEATVYLRALCEAASDWDLQVRLSGRDRYGRYIGRVSAHGVDWSLAMVSSGRAWWYETYARDAFDLMYAESVARTAGIGVWADVMPVPPWAWRRGRR